MRRFSNPHFPTPSRLTLDIGEETERRIEREARRWQRVTYLCCIGFLLWCLGYGRGWWGW